MWARLRANVKAKEIASRPHYIKMYDGATEQHMISYFDDL